jgi:hypothetical protein
MAYYNSTDYKSASKHLSLARKMGVEIDPAFEKAIRSAR